MSLHNPENMLSSLNAALRRLRAATSVFADKELENSLLAVMRRLLLSEVLNDTWLVAIGGAQGAGKTTLLAALYGMHGDGAQWLKGNEGRGEKMPVLVTEVNGLDKPQGFVRRLVQQAVATVDAAPSSAPVWQLQEEPVDMAAFQKAITDPEPSDLLPVLKVPKKFFDAGNQAWLLLPGYEKQDRDNAAWQTLMRQALVAAGGCIIVTDPTRLPDKLQQEIVRDMLSNELKHTQPYVIITKTESLRGDETALQQVCASAKTVYGVPEAHILCTGVTQDDYVQQWLPQLGAVIDALTRNGSTQRSLQLSELAQLVGDELGQVLRKVRTQNQLRFRAGQCGDEQELVDEILDRFRESRAALQAEYKKAVDGVLGAKYQAASALLDDTLIKKHEGLVQNVKNYFLRTSTAKQLALRHAANEAWAKGSEGLFVDYAQALQSITSKHLGREGGEPKQLTQLQVHNQSMAQQHQQFLESSKGQQWQQLGYVGPGGAPTRYARLTPAAISDMKILLNPEAHLATDDGEAHSQRGASRALRKSTQLIPATALEYMRLVYTAPALLKLPTLHPQSQGEVLPEAQALPQANVVESGVDNFGKAMDLGKTAIKSLATLLAVDVATDGDSDILAAIFGVPQGEGAVSDSSDGTNLPPVAGPAIAAMTPVLLNPAVAVAAGVVAAGYLTSKALEHVRDIDSNNRVQAHRVLARIHDHYQLHFNEQFDMLMNTTAQNLEESLRARYRLDETVMYKERVAVAMAEVNALAAELQARLASSPAGLQLFNAAHA